MPSGPNKRAGETGPNIWPRGEWNHETRAKFLDELSKTGRKAHSARAAGVSYQTYKNHVKLDPTLADECEDAMELYKDDLRKEINRRAVEGVEEPVFYQGDICGSVTKYSDRMLELEAKRHMPEYRDRQQVDHNVNGGVLLIPTTPEEPADVWAERSNKVGEN